MEASQIIIACEDCDTQIVFDNYEEKHCGKCGKTYQMVNDQKKVYIKDSRGVAVVIFM